MTQKNGRRFSYIISNWVKRMDVQMYSTKLEIVWIYLTFVQSGQKGTPTWRSIHINVGPPFSSFQHFTQNFPYSCDRVQSLYPWGKRHARRCIFDNMLSCIQPRSWKESAIDAVITEFWAILIYFKQWEGMSVVRCSELILKTTLCCGCVDDESSLKGVSIEDLYKYLRFSRRI